MALLAAVVAVGFSLMRLHVVLRHVSQSVSTLIEVVASESGLARQQPRSDSGWPDTASVQPGQVLPRHVDVPKGEWTILLLGSEGDTLDGVLPSPDVVSALAERYHVVVVGPEDTARSIPGIARGSAPMEVLHDLPPASVLMVDPDGIVQGTGALASEGDLLAFVREGEHQGFGPGRSSERV